MRLYLVRHGDALDAKVDAERPLSEVGREQVSAQAQFLAGLDVGIARVCHSGKPRARQTAEILAAALAPAAPVEELAGLAPNDPVAPLVEQLAGWRDDSLIAGHLPHLGRLATALLTGRDLTGGLDFAPAATACLARDEEGRWSLLWLVDPALLAAAPERA